MLPSLAELCPALRASGVTEITPAFLGARGIRALILDLDNTLVTWHGLEVAPEVGEWVRAMHEADVALCIVSNTHRTGRLKGLSTLLGIPFVPSGGKPRRRGFLRAMAAMDSTAVDTAVVGDQLLTDIWGGNRCGMLTILVEPISPVEWWGTKVVHRTLERLLFRRMEQRGIRIDALAPSLPFQHAESRGSTDPAPNAERPTPNAQRPDRMGSDER